VKTSVRLSKALLRSVLLYGSKEWKITRSEERTLDAFQHKCLRRILGTRWQLRVTNEEVTARVSTNDISDELRRRK